MHASVDLSGSPIVVDRHDISQARQRQYHETWLTATRIRPEARCRHHEILKSQDRKGGKLRNILCET